MQIITNILFLHPFVVEFSIIFAALAAALFLAFWGGKKLFISLVAKSRRGASVAAFIWYTLLFFYFSIVIFILPHAILIDLGFSQNDIDRLYFAAGNYPVVFFFIFLIVGAAMLIASIKKQTVSIPTPVPVSLVRSLWRGTRREFLIIVLVFLALTISRVPAVQDKQRTAEAVKKIHAQKITMADVMGQNLPPEPDARLSAGGGSAFGGKDSSIAGIDANGNGIRDDVELAIFKLHPDSAKIRAAELQYAMALQTIITQVFNSETWKAAAFEHSRGYTCISQTYPREDLQKHSQVIDERIKEIQDLIINTQARKNAKDLAYDFTTSFGLANKDFCDVLTENL